jgi:two-component system response regulator HydG
MVTRWNDASGARIGPLSDGTEQPLPPAILTSVPEWNLHSGAGSPASIAAPGAALHLLVVDGDDAVRGACSEIATKMGFVVVVSESIPAARAILKHRRVDLMLMDLKSPGGDALMLVEEVKTLNPETSVIVMTAYATVTSAVEAMRIGAGDYLTKPFALDELATILARAGDRRQFNLESRRLRERLRGQHSIGPLIGKSPEMEKLYRILSKVAGSTHPVMVLGEAGTGKELVARSIHFNGPNANKPFVPVDCGSLVPALIETELFGYAKGAFPGAMRAKEGLLAAAQGGTVFLDEIGELPLELQAKLLKALQDKEIRPQGSNQGVPIAARILASTNKDLNAMVEQGRFRRDLYFRLNVVSLRIPALRDHKEDIPMLVEHFLERNRKETGTERSVSDEALRVLTEYEWPGNVRELEGVIERACALSSGPVMHVGDLPPQLQELRKQVAWGRGSRANVLEPSQAGVGGYASPSTGSRYESEFQGTREPMLIVSIAELEKKAILGTIQQLQGDKLMAARLLGIGKTTLYRKLKEYGINGDE